MRHSLICKIGLIIFSIMLLSQGTSFAQVDWGVSDDNDLPGDTMIAHWLLANKYAANLTDAKLVAKTGYKGYGGSQDPFYWTFTKGFTAQIVKEMGAYENQNTFGYYTGAGQFQSLSQVFSGTQNGPATVMTDQTLGFYIGTPQDGNWFTDRGKNMQQNGSLLRSGGNHQALIYELKPNFEWLLAWEEYDASERSSDRDYNDMYVKLTVAPEPLGVALYAIGGGAFGLGAWRKRKLGKEQRA